MKKFNLSKPISVYMPILVKYTISFTIYLCIWFWVFYFNINFSPSSFAFKILAFSSFTISPCIGNVQRKLWKGINIRTHVCNSLLEIISLYYFKKGKNRQNLFKINKSLWFLSLFFSEWYNNFVISKCWYFNPSTSPHRSLIYFF